MENLAVGFAFVQVNEEQGALRVLLVRPARQDAHWVLPSALEGEDIREFFDAVRAALFSSRSSVEQVAGAFKTLNTPSGACTFHLVRAAHAEINPQFDSDRFFDARWASFEEAFHVSAASMEGALRWAERQSRKYLALAPCGSQGGLAARFEGSGTFAPPGIALA